MLSVLQVGYVACLRDAIGVTVDYIGVWNERYWGGADCVWGVRAG